MKKFTVISLVICLIFFTAIIKNSTKRIDDEIFTVRENIRILEKEHKDNKLEYDYLSSAERLIEFKRLYFDDELKKKNIQQIGTIRKKNNLFQIETPKLIEE